MKMPHVLAMIGDHDGCALWRVLQPFSELQRIGYKRAEWGYRGDDRIAWVVHNFDAVILPRLHWPMAERDGMVKWFDALHRAGITVIYEVDDDMFSEDFEKRLMGIHNKEQVNAAAVRESILATLAMVDGVTVSSQRLATVVRQYVQVPVKVVPNYMDVRWFRGIQAQVQRSVNGLTIGWAGGIRPDSDVEMMAIAWGRIARRYPQVTFVLMGHQAQVVYDNVPEERIRPIKWMPIEKYPAGLVDIDIGCCPLDNSFFNRAKTYIKAMEYSTGGAAVVASPTVYGQIIEDGVDGYICETVDEWELALSRMIESANRRKRMAQHLTRRVETELCLEENVWRWPAAWLEIIESYQAEAVSPQERSQILLPDFIRLRRREKVADAVAY